MEITDAATSFLIETFHGIMLHIVVAREDLIGAFPG
jgi:hypothetical protein